MSENYYILSGNMQGEKSISDPKINVKNHNEIKTLINNLIKSKKEKMVNIVFFALKDQNAGREYA